jgi:hypothetical protein
MDSPRFPLCLSLIGLSLLLILAADTWLIPPAHLFEIYDRGYTADIRGSGTRSGAIPHTITLYYILSTTGDKFHIPYELRDSYSLGANDTFYVDRSRLFRQPLTLWYPGSHGFIPMHMEVLNGILFGQLMALYIIVAALAQFLPIIPAKNKENLSYFSIAIAVFLFIYYFYH